MAADLPYRRFMQPLPSDTDEQTVTRVLAGEIQAFEVLMRRYNQRLYRAARAVLGNDDDAEDAVQQGYVNAYRQLRQFEGRAKFSTWLTRIVVHVALSKRRRRRVRASEPLNSRALAGETVDPERYTYGVELKAVLQAAVQSLPASYRLVFILREVDGLTTAEAANRLSLTEGATKARLHRAKGLLRQALKAQWHSQ
jgi:RNA polymerase sigma-70 factor (ECF subfamily)